MSRGADPARGKVALQDLTMTFVDKKRGRETTALRDVSLVVGEREFVCLLGPSGCGKSTILNLIAGFEHASAGRVLLDGREVRRPGPDRAMVFQQPQLFPWLTVVDNITFGPRMTGRRAREYMPLAERYMQLMGLAGFERHYPYELSGGMQQRVALARAWITEPELFLMDEPFGALDAQTRTLMQELLLRVWGESRTAVVFVTHDVDEALFLADRVLVMTARPGRIKEELKMPFRRPRDYETLIFDEGYIKLKQHVLHVIREETMRAIGGELPQPEGARS